MGACLGGHTARTRTEFRVSIFEFRVFQARAQRLPLQQLHGDKRVTPVLVNIVDGADVGMVEGGGGLGRRSEEIRASPFACLALRFRHWASPSGGFPLARE